MSLKCERAGMYLQIFVCVLKLPDEQQHRWKQEFGLGIFTTQPGAFVLNDVLVANTCLHLVTDLSLSVLGKQMSRI